MPDKLRCFIALDLPENVVSELKKIQQEIWKQDVIIGKLTEEENIHLTLKFLGSISSGILEQVRRKLKSIKFNSFEASIKEVGVFSPEFVRIIWAKMGGKEVFELQSLIDNALSDLFPKEERFMSHITISRVKNIKDKGKLIAFINRYKMEEIKGKITSFSLITSELRPEGPKFTVIEKYNLK